MKIVITGAAGRMGKRLVANIAAQPDLELAGATEWSGSEFLGTDAGLLAGAGPLNVPLTASLEPLLDGADAVIDFSTGSTLDNARLCAEHKVALVIGTTALSAEVLSGLAGLAADGARIVQSYNYSIGVNVLFHLTRIAAKALPADFDIEITEAHHNKKKDAPSGTAVSLADILCQARGLSYETDVRHGREGLVGARTKQEIGMHSIRGGDIVGDHTVMFIAEGERLELTHRAASRDMFARGAIRAARWVVNAAPGKVYSMQDVLAELFA